MEPAYGYDGARILGKVGWWSEHEGRVAAGCHLSRDAPALARRPWFFVSLAVATRS